MTAKKKSLLVILLFAVIVFVGVVLRLWIDSTSPYRAFRTKELQIIPQLDALNETVANSLPLLPNRSVEEKRWSVGIDNPINEHGRYLFVHVSTKMSAGDVSAYYRQQLLSAGWTEDAKDHISAVDFYHRDRTCIRISLPGQHLDNYELMIWNDFRSQPFSPLLPDLDQLRFADSGETKIATCPP